MSRKRRLYVYKLVTDNGGAPCVSHGRLSLAICKPRIRSAAREDDWIFGFAGKPLGSGRLIYIAQVTNRVRDGHYYKDGAYKGRPDRIYRLAMGTYVLRDGARYHYNHDHRDRDLGKDRSNANVLLSDNFRFFGKKGKKPNPRQYPRLTRLLSRLTQGHRVNFGHGLQQEVHTLRKAVWKAHPTAKALGRPTQADCSESCCQSEGHAVSGCAPVRRVPASFGKRKL